MKKLLIIAIVLLVIAIGLLSYLIIDSRTETEEINKNVSGTNGNENLNINTAEPVTEWEMFKNEKHSYSFQYPSNCQVTTNHTMSPKETANVLEVAGTGCRGPALNIRVYNEENVLPENKEQVQKNLLDFTNTVYGENLNDENSNVEKVLGDIKETQINYQKAYSFTVSGGFIHPNGSFLLKEEHKFIFTEKDGNKFILWQPVDSSISPVIVSTFQFTE